ncbi:MAG: ABC transporter substrate-binding protein [Rhodospirillales bacterium]
MRFGILTAVGGAAFFGLFSSLFSTGVAFAADPTADARAAAAHIGRIVGANGECAFVAQTRVRAAADKAKAILGAFATDLPDVPAAYEKGLIEGREAIGVKQSNCAQMENELTDLEHQATPWLPDVPKTATPVPPAPAPVAAVASAPAAVAAPVAAIVPAPATVVAVAPSPAPVAAVPPTPVPVATQPAVHGVGDKEIRFGLVAPFGGPSRATGTQLKLGTLLAFAVANDTGGIEGRKLALIAADDGYDPTRTPEVVKQLYEKNDVFGFIANYGTATAEVALPYALSRKAIFFAPFTGAGFVRRDPPDRYSFNFRPSYAEETAAVVRYLIKTKRLRPDQIAVFAQQDSLGDAGFEGVAKALRALNPNGDGANILRLNYPRNTVEVGAAIAQLTQYQKQHAANPIKAVVMVASYRPAARFIEKAREIAPNLIYTNISAVGSGSLAEELMILGPNIAAGVIVTQVVPPVDGYAGVVLDYKAALEKHFPGETPDYVSFEAYLQATVLIEGLRRAGPNIDPERLVAALESIRDLDLGLGPKIGFSRTEHQALHKVWGTQLDATGHYQPLDLE